MQRNDLQGSAAAKAPQLSYELIELWEFERATEETAAVRSALGPPVPEDPQKLPRCPL